MVHPPFDYFWDINSSTRNDEEEGKAFCNQKKLYKKTFKLFKGFNIIKFLSNNDKALTYYAFSIRILFLICAYLLAQNR